MKRTEPLEALGQSPPFLDMQERISRAAKTDRPVILIGERGTGKELAAARLHNLSARWNKPYVTLNCASLAENLIESELFGHEAGAFTGAARRRKGRFEMADGGTLFLDEAGNIPLTAQEKILRVVEYGTLERVGSSQPMQVDCRLIAATNADLRAMAREGTFREDLLDRLSFEVITLPPLAARREDILPLAEHFARRMASELELTEPPRFTEEALAALLAYRWPGNIRELKNVVERMVYRSGGEKITSIVFDPFESPFAQRPEPAAPKVAAGQPPSLEGLPGALRGLLADLKRDKADADRRRKHGWAPAPMPMPVPLPAPEIEPQPTVPTPKRVGKDLAEGIRQLEVERIKAALEEAQFHHGRAAEAMGLTYGQFRTLYRKHRQQLEAEGVARARREGKRKGKEAEKGEEDLTTKNTEEEHIK